MILKGTCRDLEGARAAIICWDGNLADVARRGDTVVGHLCESGRASEGACLDICVYQIQYSLPSPWLLLPPLLQKSSHNKMFHGTR
jgi:hypothetical protein